MKRCAFLLCVGLSAQSLHVYSEFARIDPSTGRVTAPETPREILSPAVVRNGFTSFQIVVEVPQGKTFWLYVGQNPEDAVRVTVYRESGERLEKVDLPAEGTSTQIFWMDLWTGPDAPVRRIKVEPEVKVESDWVTYPMEVRVVDAVVPTTDFPEGYSNPGLVIRGAVCGPQREYFLYKTDLARTRFRNAQQDIALSALVPKPQLARLMTCDVPPPADDPEWYFRIRDYLFRMR
ncbi:MAG: hypothetical protein LAO79_25740 [Acidobacteriia bacterium]|nr:hypothetical protein [Terriglobia bacterium]